MVKASTELVIYVVPDDIALDELADYSPEEVGNVMSTATSLNVNRIEDGYSVIFTGEVLSSIKPQYLINNIVRIFSAQLPGYSVNISIEYLYELENDDEDDLFSMETAQAIMLLDIMFHQNLCTQNFRYQRSQSVIDTAEIYHDVRLGIDEDEGDDEEDESIIGHDFEYGDRGSIMSMLNRALHDYSEDDDDDDDDYSDHKRGSSYFDVDSSRVLKSAKNPKRAYHRHGVIVARNKGVIKKDAKIIKAFLKEFIPGNAGWKKDLRDDLLKRWMRVYAVTPKQLRKLEKQHRKMIEEQQYRPRINAERTLALTRQIFNVPVDNWSNPNK